MNGIAAFPLKASYLKTKKLQGADTACRACKQPSMGSFKGTSTGNHVLF
jgi:hypothetical protein